jgi:hypothetical protein
MVTTRTGAGADPAFGEQPEEQPRSTRVETEEEEARRLRKEGVRELLEELSAEGFYIPRKGDVVTGPSQPAVVDPAPSPAPASIINRHFLNLPKLSQT